MERKISFVIPAHNEEEGIKVVINEIKTEMNSTPWETEIVVVDDGSTDRTSQFAKEIGAKVIKNPYKLGYGASLKKGILNASNEIIVIIDADGTYPVKFIHQMLQYIDEYDMVVGARRGKYYKETFIKFPLRIVFKYLAEFTCRKKINDVNSGFRIFRKSTAKTFFGDISDGFSFTTSITLGYLLKNYTIKYVPIEYFKRKGESKIKLIRDSLGALQIITSTILYYNPIKIFVVLSFFPFLSFLIFFIIFVFNSKIDFLLFSILSFILFILFIGFGFIADIFKRILFEIRENRDENF
jgi:glycosyltransferase involved in cell wall biosynthesis